MVFFHRSSDDSGFVVTRYTLHSWHSVRRTSFLLLSHSLTLSFNHSFLLCRNFLDGIDSIGRRSENFSTKRSSTMKSEKKPHIDIADRTCVGAADTCVEKLGRKSRFHSISRVKIPRSNCKRRRCQRQTSSSTFRYSLYENFTRDLRWDASRAELIRVVSRVGVVGVIFKRTHKQTWMLFVAGVLKSKQRIASQQWKNINNRIFRIISTLGFVSTGLAFHIHRPTSCCACACCSHFSAESRLLCQIGFQLALFADSIFVASRWWYIA